MPFNVEKYRQLDLQFRTKDIPVTDPDIAMCFDDLADGDRPVWKIRNLTGEELSFINHAAEAVNVHAKLISSLLGGSDDEKIASVLALLGVGKTTELRPDYVRRLAMMEIGSVDPKIDRPTAVLLARDKPTFFYDVTNQITMLTGQGSCPGKQNASGETPA